MPLFRRADGDHVKKVPAYCRIMPTRTESAVYFEQTIDATRGLAYIGQWNHPHHPGPCRRERRSLDARARRGTMRARAGRGRSHSLKETRTMSLTFYYAPMSTASITEAVLAELGTPCERVKLEIKAGGTKTPEFLAVNPNGKVPAIVHEGTPIWESSAITMYLGEVFGVDAKLYPAPGPKRGEAMKWIAWSNVSLAEAASRLMYNTMDWVPAEKRSAVAAETAKGDVATCLKVLDGALAGHSFLLGEYTLADTHVHSIVGWLGMMHIDLSPYANVGAWMKRCAERPAIAKMMAG